MSVHPQFSSSDPRTAPSTDLLHMVSGVAPVKFSPLANRQPPKVGVIRDTDVFAKARGRATKYDKL